MVAGRRAGLGLLRRAILLAAIVSPGSGCVTGDTGKRLLGWKEKQDTPIRLTDAEQMIDELDRVMTTYGTISVKTPDVWGQDRLAKFRSEYELQMAEWLRHGFKSDINASVRRSEVEATQVQVGANFVGPTPSLSSSPSSSSTTKATATSDDGAGVAALSKSLSGMNAGAATTSDWTGQDVTCSRAHGRARRAFELSESLEPVAAHQCRRRAGRPAGLRSVSRPDPGDALAGTEKPQG